MSQILKSVDFTKTQKSIYLENKEQRITPFSNKKIINCTLRATLHVFYKKTIFLPDPQFY